MSGHATTSKEVLSNTLPVEWRTTSHAFATPVYPADFLEREHIMRRRTFSQLINVWLTGQVLNACLQLMAMCAGKMVCVRFAPMLFLPVRGEHALALLYPGCARWRGIQHKGPRRSPRSTPPNLAARTPRTKDSSEPLLVPIPGARVDVRFRLLPQQKNINSNRVVVNWSAANQLGRCQYST